MSRIQIFNREALTNSQHNLNKTENKLKADTKESKLSKSIRTVENKFKNLIKETLYN